MGVSGVVSRNHSDYIVHSMIVTAGGICKNASNSIIANCYNTANISLSSSSYTYNTYCGGICGSVSSSTITGCYNAGNISSSSIRGYAISGGICGDASENSIITVCYNKGNISSTSNTSNTVYSGGICGYAIYGGSTITACYSAAVNISASNNNTSNSSYCGGICGYGGYVSYCFSADKQLTNSNDPTREKIGRIGGYPSHIDPVYGGVWEGSAYKCYALEATLINGDAISNLEDRSKDGKDTDISYFKSIAWLMNTLGWDFENTWRIAEGELPTLLGENILPMRLLPYRRPK